MAPLGYGHACGGNDVRATYESLFTLQGSHDQIESIIIRIYNLNRVIG